MLVCIFARARARAGSRMFESVKCMLGQQEDFNWDHERMFMSGTNGGGGGGGGHATRIVPAGGEVR